MPMRGPTKARADISSRAERGPAAAAIATRSNHRKRRNGWWHFRRLIRQGLVVWFRFRIRWLLVRIKGGVKRIVGISWSSHCSVGKNKNVATPRAPDPSGPSLLSRPADHSGNRNVHSARSCQLAPVSSGVTTL